MSILDLKDAPLGAQLQTCLEEGQSFVVVTTNGGHPRVASLAQNADANGWAVDAVWATSLAPDFMQTHLLLRYRNAP